MSSSTCVSPTTCCDSEEGELYRMTPDSDTSENTKRGRTESVDTTCGSPQDSSRNQSVSPLSDVIEQKRFWRRLISFRSCPRRDAGTTDDEEDNDDTACLRALQKSAGMVWERHITASQAENKSSRAYPTCIFRNPFDPTVVYQCRAEKVPIERRASSAESRFHGVWSQCTWETVKDHPSQDRKPPPTTPEDMTPFELALENCRRLYLANIHMRGLLELCLENIMQGDCPRKRVAEGVPDYEIFLGLVMYTELQELEARQNTAVKRGQPAQIECLKELKEYWLQEENILQAKRYCEWICKEIKEQILWLEDMQKMDDETGKLAVDIFVAKCNKQFKFPANNMVWTWQQEAHGSALRDFLFEPQYHDHQHFERLDLKTIFQGSIVEHQNGLMVHMWYTILADLAVSRFDACILSRGCTISAPNEADRNQFDRLWSTMHGRTSLAYRAYANVGVTIQKYKMLVDRIKEQYRSRLACQDRNCRSPSIGIEDHEKAIQIGESYLSRLGNVMLSITTALNGDEQSHDRSTIHHWCDLSASPFGTLISMSWIRAVDILLDWHAHESASDRQSRVRR